MQRNFSNRGEAHAESVAAKMSARRNLKPGNASGFPGRHGAVIWREPVLKPVRTRKTENAPGEGN